jgi:hypothetical protein
VLGPLNCNGKTKSTAGGELCLLKRFLYVVLAFSDSAMGLILVHVTVKKGYL